MVEIALRALSPAVSHTFTAPTSVDWLGESLCKDHIGLQPERDLRRPGGGQVRFSNERSIGRTLEQRDSVLGVESVLEEHDCADIAPRFDAVGAAAARCLAEPVRVPGDDISKVEGY